MDQMHSYTVIYCLYGRVSGTHRREIVTNTCLYIGCSIRCPIVKLFNTQI